MAASRARLKKAEQLDPEHPRLRETLDFWFTHLDGVTKHLGTKVGEFEVPLEYFAALVFLLLEEGSPYYGNKEIHDKTELDVAEVLASAKDMAQNLIETCVAIGGPIPSSA